MRFHMAAFPGRNTTEEFAWDAYMADIRDFANMMTPRGHEVIIYGPYENDAACAEFVRIATRREEKAARAGSFTGPLFQAYQADYWYRVVKAMKRRHRKTDFILLVGGRGQEPLVEAFTGFPRVEYLVGYGAQSCYPGLPRNYPSYAQRNNIEGQFGGQQGDVYSNVIKNPMRIPERYDVEKKGYMLLLGRMVDGKGLQIANLIAERTGKRLVLAGPGEPVLAPLGEYVGIVTGQEKEALLRGADVLLSPSLYQEPFGRAHVEALMRGVPVISTDFGIYPETVINGFNGRRCRSMREFVEAVDEKFASADDIARQACDAYGFDPVTGLGRPGDEFEAWFDRLTRGFWVP